jgi:hypothetical protein
VAGIAGSLSRDQEQERGRGNSRSRSRSKSRSMYRRDEEEIHFPDWTDARARSMAVMKPVSDSGP